jgi:hypothetical protein
VSLVLVALLGTLALGRLLGGSVERLGTLPLRRRRLAVAALAVQVLAAVVGGPPHAVGLAVAAALVVALLAANRGVRGTGLVALGLLANALAVGVNGGVMPVSGPAAARAGVDLADVRSGADPRHAVAGDGVRLRLLTDVVPLPLPLRPEVVSAGDVAVAAGLAQLVVVGMLRPLRPVPALPRRRPVGRSAAQAQVGGRGE